MLETRDHLKSTTGTKRTMRKTVEPADVETVVKTKIPVIIFLRKNGHIVSKREFLQ